MGTADDMNEIDRLIREAETDALGQPVTDEKARMLFFETMDEHHKLYLRADELAWLTENTQYDGTQGPLRCKCGHLYALHNFHCCTFCMVPGCACGD
jgi:hypothetical protein